MFNIASPLRVNLITLYSTWRPFVS